MHVHAQLLMPVNNTSYSVNVVLVSVYSYTHAFTPSYETAKFVRPIERGRIDCLLISVFHIEVELLSASVVSDARHCCWLTVL